MTATLSSRLQRGAQPPRGKHCVSSRVLQSFGMWQGDMQPLCECLQAFLQKLCYHESWQYYAWYYKRSK